MDRVTNELVKITGLSILKRYDETVSLAKCISYLNFQLRRLKEFCPDPENYPEHIINILDGEFFKMLNEITKVYEPKQSI